jgi:hypothetical protein
MLHEPQTKIPCKISCFKGFSPHSCFRFLIIRGSLMAKYNKFIKIIDTKEHLAGALSKKLSSSQCE